MKSGEGVVIKCHDDARVQDLGLLDLPAPLPAEEGVVEDTVQHSQRVKSTVRTLTTSRGLGEGSEGKSDGIWVEPLVHSMVWHTLEKRLVRNSGVYYTTLVNYLGAETTK